MKIEFDSSKLKISTKRIAAAIATVGTLMQVPAVKDAVVSFVAAHPHFSSIAVTVGTLWTLLHNPEVEQILGLGANAPDPKA